MGTIAGARVARNLVHSDDCVQRILRHERQPRLPNQEKLRWQSRVGVRENENMHTSVREREKTNQEKERRVHTHARTHRLRKKKKGRGRGWDGESERDAKGCKGEIVG